MTRGGDASASAYRPEIDGLRALSVVAVIVNHLEKSLLPNGHLGVDIFFVISGYVITASLVRARGAGLGETLLAFYTRRVRRLVPALVACVVTTGLLVCLFAPEPGPFLRTGIASLFGVSNVYLFLRSTDYFAPSTELNVFTHTWSLGVEEQFYLLYPGLLWLLVLRRGAGPSVRSAVVVLSAASAASLAAFVLFSRTNQPAAFYLVPMRFWELGVGCTLFLVRGERQAAGPVAGLASSAALLALVGALFVPFRLTIPATIAVVTLTAILIATIGAGTAAYRLLAHPLSVYLGACSYSLYLWHWSIASLSRWTVGIHGWSVPVLVALMLLLADASHRFVEVPLRHARWSARPWGTLAIGLVASAAAAALLAGLAGPAAGRLFLGRQPGEEKRALGAIPAQHAAAFARARELRVRCNMTPHHLTGSSYRPKPVVDEVFLAACVGPKGGDGRRKMVVVGDSFANAAVPHLVAAADQLDYEFRLLFGYGCPYPLPFRDLEGGAASACKEVDEQLLRRVLLDSLGEGDLLVVRLYLEKDQYLDFADDSSPEPWAYDRALEDLAREVASRGASLVLVGSNPTLTVRQLVALAPQWFNRTAVAESASVMPSDNRETAFFHRLDDHLRGRFETLPAARYLSLRPFLCDSEDVCPLWSGGKPLWSDAYHVNGDAFDLAFPALRAAVAGESSVAAPHEP